MHRFTESDFWYYVYIQDVQCICLCHVANIAHNEPIYNWVGICAIAHTSRAWRVCFRIFNFVPVSLFLNIPLPGSSIAKNGQNRPVLPRSLWGARLKKKVAGKLHRCKRHHLAKFHENPSNHLGEWACGKINEGIQKTVEKQNSWLSWEWSRSVRASRRQRALTLARK